MSDIPVDSYDPGVRPGAFAERWQRTVWTAQFAAWFSDVSVRLLKAPVRDTGIRGDEGALRAVEQAMRA